MCSGRVRSSCSTSGTRRVDLVTNPLITHECGKDRKVLTRSGTYPWSFVTTEIQAGVLVCNDDNTCHLAKKCFSQYLIFLSVGNKWIREAGQMFKRPCDLQP